METTYIEFSSSQTLYSVFKVLKAYGLAGKTPLSDAKFMSVCGVTGQINTSNSDKIILRGHENFIRIA
jgi:hypothetical protein